MELIFWLSAFGVVYAYAGYPLLLLAWGRLAPRPVLHGDERTGGEEWPGLSIIVPAYNEEKVIGDKILNTLALDYPADRFELIVVSDGSTDETAAIVGAHPETGRLRLLEQPRRAGKAAALNLGMAHAKFDILVFSDSSIQLEPDALRNIARGFRDPAVGCISGEDHIRGGGGEGLYGRYELFLRNQESRIGSIVGASGSFYAQRKTLCPPFVEGLAPDFLSVLNAVERGARAVTEPTAIGYMTAVKAPQDEFRRKVRTLLRGMATLWYKRGLLNPARYGAFSFLLASHKLLRWLAPLFMLLAFAVNLALLDRPIYVFTLLAQVAFYALALLASFNVLGLQERALGRIPLYFVSANLAVAVAWGKFLAGVRQEIWEPSKRAGS